MKDSGADGDSKDILTAFANLMVRKLSHEEIMIFCIAMLDAEMKCRKVIQNEKFFSVPSDEVRKK